MDGVTDGVAHKRALGCERELEQRRLERRSQFARQPE